MIYWIWLTQIPFIGPVTTRYLIKELGDAEKIYQADHETLSEMSGLSARQRESIIRNHSLEKAKRIMDDCQSKNISILCWNDDRYPLRAREPADAPPMLYYKGNIKKMDQTVGIVGARRCSQEAKQETVFLHQNMQRPGLQLSAEWPKESTAMHILHVSMPVATQ